MATPERLIGLGMEAEKAKRIGFFVQQSGANLTVNGPSNFFVETSATVNLGSAFDVGDRVTIAAITTVNVNPDSGSRISLKATASAAVVSAGVCREFFRSSPTQWWVIANASL